MGLARLQTAVTWLLADVRLRAKLAAVRRPLPETERHLGERFTETLACAAGVRAERRRPASPKRWTPATDLQT